jgi:hypothetical protein
MADKCNNSDMALSMFCATLDILNGVFITQIEEAETSAFSNGPIRHGRERSAAFIGMI